MRSCFFIRSHLIIRQPTVKITDGFFTLALCIPSNYVVLNQIQKIIEEESKAVRCPIMIKHRWYNITKRNNILQRLYLDSSHVDWVLGPKRTIFHWKKQEYIYDLCLMNHSVISGIAKRRLLHPMMGNRSSSILLASSS